MDRNYWDSYLRARQDELGFDEGYHLLYNPWHVIGATETVFLSLNPGKAPENTNRFMVSDERGNSYEVEKYITKSPITQQVLSLAHLLKREPAEILMGTVAPYRSGSWGSLSKLQQSHSLEIGKAFWAYVFNVKRPKLIITSGKEPAKLASSILNLSFEESEQSGWGNVKISIYRNDHTRLIQLPHLSRFKLFSRPESIKRLNEIF